MIQKCDQEMQLTSVIEKHNSQDHKSTSWQVCKFVGLKACTQNKKIQKLNSMN